VEGDIAACFDEISHPALMNRVRRRIADRRVLDLVKAFLKAGILSEDKVLRETTAGTSQGSILSPLLSNVALSVLDEHIAALPGGPRSTTTERAKRRRHGLPNYRLVRYADDWCLVINGTEGDAEALKEGIAAVLSTMGLRLSVAKTLITHIDDGLDFLGWRIHRHRKRGTTRTFVYTYGSARGQTRPGFVPRWDEDVQLFNVMVHRLSDATRHAGHADILREQLDGSVGVESSNLPLHGRDVQFWNTRSAELERIARASDRPGSQARVEVQAHSCVGGRSGPVDPGCAPAHGRSSTRCAPAGRRWNASTHPPHDPPRSPPARRSSGSGPSARDRGAAAPAGLDQHTAPGAPTGVDDSHRVGDETAASHHLPEPLQEIRTNEDRILSHRQHPISRRCDHRENPRILYRGGEDAKRLASHHSELD